MPELAPESREAPRRSAKEVAIRALVIAGIVVGVAFAVSIAVSRPRFDERLASGLIESVAIAPLDQALTFARYRAADGSLRVLLVRSFADGKVRGFDVNEEGATDEPDPVRLFAGVGYDALAVLGSVDVEPVTVDVAMLVLPFSPREHNIGVGANYAEHARESSLDEQPFVFPKFARPTLFSSDVSRAGSRLLDYEAELGLVLLQDLGGADAVPTQMGLVLANELTDRWALVRNMQPGSLMGTTGFADGKSREGFAPIGPLLVIPREFETFYRQIGLRLYLNGQLRQRDHASHMMWGPTRIVGETFRRSTWPFRYRGQKTALLPPGGLPAGTILFSGTPAGVIFKPLNLWNPWVYLRPGDDVIVQADFLGSIRNRIVE